MNQKVILTTAGNMLNSKAVIETMSWLFESMDRGMSTMDNMAASMHRMEIYMLMLVALMYSLTIIGLCGIACIASALQKKRNRAQGICGIAMHLLSRRNAKERKRRPPKANRVNHISNHQDAAATRPLQGAGSPGLQSLTPVNNKHNNPSQQSAHSIYQIKPGVPEQAV